MEEVVFHLLGNALKFVGPGVRPQIEIYGEERERTTRLWVSDNGIGIAPEHHAKIFRLFDRLHGTSSGYPGTGVGLAIVAKAMERLGGQAGVESALGQGSRFWVELPKA
jgi:signal transduction histidine kinase